MKINRVLKPFLLVITTGIILLQLGWAGQQFGDLARRKVWSDRFLDAISRSADVAYGTDYLAYVDFLRKEIPMDALVVDTRTFGVPQFDDNTFLQYFLLPRMVVGQSDSTCPGISSLKDCLQSMAGPQVYFIYGPTFDNPSSVPGTLKVIPFNATMGLLAPQDAEAGQ
jgi:hypothetical protein